MSHLLVTNDFPPKTGGIQTYLWELWKRLPRSEAFVLTTSFPEANSWDLESPIEISRIPNKVMLPSSKLARVIRNKAAELNVSHIIFDPAFPVGLLGSHIGLPYSIIVHGAELTVPARLPILKNLLAGEVQRSIGIIAAGGYPALEVQRLIHRNKRIPVRVVMPGVDTSRFVPLSSEQKIQARVRLNIEPHIQLVTSISRLVPRKGMDTLILASSTLKLKYPHLKVLIGGAGRDQKRLESMVAKTRAPVQFLGEIKHEQLPEIYGASDLFVMACRDRWAGLEQEGFGVVFLEAAACGIPQIAGSSGGSHEAVADGISGLVLENSSDPAELAAKISYFLDNPEIRSQMGSAARHRAEQEFGYDYLSEGLFEVIKEFENSIPK